MSTAIPTTYTYHTDDSRPVQLDFHPPTEYKPETEKYKTLIFFHGGGLVFGNRKTYPPFDIMSRIAPKGWIFISADYHLLPESSLDYIRQDIAALQEWTLKHSNELGIDTERVSVASASAGSFVAMLLLDQWKTIKLRSFVNLFGMVDTAAKPYTEPRATAKTVGINLVSDLQLNVETYKRYLTPPFGPRVWDDQSALNDLNNRTGLMGWLFLEGKAANLISGYDMDVILDSNTAFTPLKLVSSAFPPAITVHGDQDTSVPIDGAYALAKAYEHVGIVHQMEIVAGAEHGLINADCSQVWERVVLFLEAH
ncbi:hypothetical protein HK100_004727 [Physocladia obscura]|uniref:Alpha/beta hydrolase fold-3 domain-containing protein n=1 Tax=Physocladia obscura TaxID=109957 RepID=A0AAD5TC27_9FUNG|nr:hypothetical protein HK100_004727 [Physocladia obscura]